MKMSEDDIKKALERIDIPEPTETARNRAVQEAMAEFAKKKEESANKTKGFAGIIRQMGKTLHNLTTLQGEPIMTQRQFATVGILVVAVGLVVALGPQYFFTPETQVEFTEPKTPQPQVPEIRQQQAPEVVPQQAVPPEPTTDAETPQPTPAEVRQPPEKVKLEEPVRQMTDAIQAPAAKGGQATNAPQPAAPVGKELAVAPLPSMSAESNAVRARSKKGLEGEGGGDVYSMPQRGYYQDEGRDRFTEIKANGVKLVGEEPVSTFSLDVDTASYAFVRRQLNSGVLPQKDSVRVEELINYFAYDYPVPADKSQPFQPSVAVYPTPWNKDTRLLHIGIKGYDIIPAEKPRSNLVFLLDVSGSMNSPDKLPLLKNSLSMLVDTLSPEDSVGIVVYAGAAGTILEPTKIREKGKILTALDRLQAGGSTAGGDGIRLAYALAEMNYQKDAVNRVILATDGDFNVGITDRNELQSFIERKRQTGVFLSVLGFGQGNYNDALMQALAQNGNGNAAYIDSLSEARKVLVDEAGSTLFTIAKDVKIQVEFNPARVHDYRLIGYETRLLNREDFNNDKVDAGEVGSGRSVTAIYEFTPAESGQKLIDDLRYVKAADQAKPEPASEFAFLKIRYKLPQEDVSRLITQPIADAQAYAAVASAPTDMRFAAAVAAFGQLLRNDPFTGNFSYDEVLKLAEPARGRDQFGYRSEFLNLVRLAKTGKAM
jgi:Ca-activated chloride channel family protein